MYIFNIIEIEQLIFSYLDYCVDFTMLKQVSKNYENMICNHRIYKKLYHFNGWKMTSIEDKFIDACKTNIFIVKYLFYKYLYVYDEYAFCAACNTNNLEIAKWLWSSDENINIHAAYEYAFKFACENGKSNFSLTTKARLSPGGLFRCSQVVMELRWKY